MFFELPIVPTAQQRIRHTWTGWTYKSITQKSNEYVLDEALLAHKPKTPLEGPVRLIFTAYMPIPASIPKKQRQAILDGKIGYVKKPDVDNLSKQLLDAMTRLQFWTDDRQVVELTARKSYSDNPHWAVTLEPVKYES